MIYGSSTLGNLMQSLRNYKRFNDRTMTTETITFTPKQELKKGMFLLVRAVATIFKGAAHLIDLSVHRYPYLWVLLILFTTFITSFVCIGRARAERDSLNKQNYELQQKVESLTNILEARKELGE